jgi:hypothetical protein
LQINQSGSASASESSWIDVPIDPTLEYDLLSLTGGVTELLGNVSLTAGPQVNQIRFLEPTVEVVETTDPALPITRKPCDLPSGSLKIVNAFDVPLTGTLTLTVDFDVRKSLIVTGGGGGQGGQGSSYRMKPVLRAVVDNEAGSIKGSIPEGYAIYAYKDETYVSTEETADPADADSVPFSNSVTSAKAVEGDTACTWHYTLAFLEAGTYDLVVVDLATETDVVDSITYSDVTVTSGDATTQDIVAIVAAIVAP